MLISSAYAQTAPAAAGGSDMQSSQMRRQKEHRTMVDALAKGDEVVTAGGVLGKVTKLGDQYLGVEVANGVEMQVQRSAVTQVLPKGTVK